MESLEGRMIEQVAFATPGMVDNSSAIDSSTPPANTTAAAHEGSTFDAESGLVVVAVSALAVVTIAGNLLTIAAFCRDKKLRANISNWYLVNLACADLVVGCVSLPTDAVLYAYQGSFWSLGDIACKLLLTVDFSATTGSICAIVLISLDRYRLVTRELSYKMSQTKGKVLLHCSLAWLAVGLTMLFMIWAYPYLISKNSANVYYEGCEAEFLFHRGLAIVYAILTCFIPLSLLLYFNICVYVDVYRRSRRRSSQRAPVDQPPEIGNANELDRLQIPVVMHTVGSSNGCQNNQKESSGSNGRANAVVAAAIQASRARDRRHVKTAKTLAIIVGAYLICWAPYNIMLIVTTICPSGCIVPETAWAVCLYLLWFNSTLNPFLYGMCNLQFRQNFNDMLNCRCFARKHIGGGRQF